MPARALVCFVFEASRNIRNTVLRNVLLINIYHHTFLYMSIKKIPYHTIICTYQKTPIAMLRTLIF